MPPTKSALLVSNLFSVGDTYGSVCQELAHHLTQCGWHVTTTSHWKNRRLRPLDMVATAWRAQRRYQVAHIDVFSDAAFRWAELTARTLRALHKPYVLTLHGGKLPEFAATHPARVRALLQSADCVVTPSRYLLDNMAQYHPDIRLIPNPLPLERYPFRLRSAPSPTLLFLRALSQMYNPALSVRALEKLVEDYPDVHLSIVGPDHQDGTAAALHRMIDSGTLSEQVTIVGAVAKTDVPHRMNQADIFLNTTNVDNTPISVMEAMACGLCIVSTNVGGIPYLLTHEQDALLVPPDDADAMAAAIRRILTEPGLAERLSRSARAKAETLSWSSIIHQWDSLLQTVMPV